MRRFLYFVPGLVGANEQILVQLGLGPRFIHLGNVLPFCVTGGIESPEGITGCVIAYGEYVPKIDWKESNWIKGLKFWVGIESVKPGPEDLSFPIGIDGVEMEMGDGQKWVVPCLRLWDAANAEFVVNLPTAPKPIMVDGKYAFKRVVVNDYKVIDEVADSILAHFLENRKISEETRYSWCASILGTNYRIGIEEIGLLGLLVDDLDIDIPEASIDLSNFQKSVEEFASRGVKTMPERK